MPPRFAAEVEEYLRVSGPLTLRALVIHFAKWGADSEDLRLALETLIREGRVERVTAPEERYRSTGARGRPP